jgi:hypothetical protein
VPARAWRFESSSSHQQQKPWNDLPRLLLFRLVLASLVCVAALPLRSASGNGGHCSGVTSLLTHLIGVARLVTPLGPSSRASHAGDERRLTRVLLATGTLGGLFGCFNALLRRGGRRRVHSTTRQRGGRYSEAPDQEPPNRETSGQRAPTRLVANGLNAHGDSSARGNASCAPAPRSQRWALSRGSGDGSLPTLPTSRNA